jgi:ABC-type nitrate/sulfonate/bicarbonate transport system substrate-binding protein
MNKILRTLALLIVSWTVPFSVSAAPDVVVGYANISARVSPLWIAQEKGFFAKYGVSVQPVYMPGSPVMIASLSTGQIQLANSGGTAALGAAAGGLDLKVIGTFTSRIPFDLVVKPTIKSAHDLRGKRLGVQVIGGTIWMGAMLGLEHLGSLYLQSHFLA